MPSLPPVASAIIPAYNQAQHLAHYLSAILGDAQRDIEVLAIDDTSTDHTVEIARASGVRVVCNATNRGPAYGRDLGVQHTRAEILIFVDADVVVVPEAVRQMADFMGRDAGHRRRIRPVRCQAVCAIPRQRVSQSWTSLHPPDEQGQCGYLLGYDLPTASPVMKAGGAA